MSTPRIVISPHFKGAILPIINTGGVFQQPASYEGINLFPAVDTLRAVAKVRSY
jgi:hypothetical protein